MLSYLENHCIKEKKLATTKANTLFRKNRFALNFLTQRNASKFAMFMEKENPSSFFHFCIDCKISSSMSTQTRAFIRVKLKVALNEKRKKLLGFSFCINIANFEAFLQVKKLSENLLFLKSDLFKFFSNQNFLLDDAILGSKQLKKLYIKKKLLMQIRKLTPKFF